MLGEWVTREAARCLLLAVSVCLEPAARLLDCLLLAACCFSVF